MLAADLESPIDVPPFDGSAMDGYAVAAGPGAELEVDGESRAGRPASERLRDGAAIRISTGAAVPSGADAVVPLERVKERGARVRVPDTVVGDNVRYAGEDIPAGSTVLRAGTVLDPAALGAAAAVGSATLSCARRPRMAVLVTGDELDEARHAARPGRHLLLERVRARRAGRGRRRRARPGRDGARPTPSAPATRSPGHSRRPTW